MKSFHPGQKDRMRYFGRRIYSRKQEKGRRGCQNEEKCFSADEFSGLYCDRHWICGHISYQLPVKSGNLQKRYGKCIKTDIRGYLPSDRLHFYEAHQYLADHGK